MDTNTLFLIEIVLFSGVALAWGIWEYWSVRPGKDAAKKQASSEPGHAEGQHGAHDGMREPTER